MSNTNVRVINLGSYTTPKINVESRTDWVPFGEDNNYYQELIDRYNGSATTNAVINGIADMIYGQGLEARDAKTNVEGYVQVKKLFKPQVMRRVSHDIKHLGHAAFQLIYNEDKTKVIQVEHIPVETLRMEKIGESGEVEAFYYSRDWTKIRKKGYEPSRIPALGHGDKSEKLEILFIKPYRSGQYYYSTVDYQGGIPYAKLEEEIANYHINNIENGFSPTMMITYPENMTDEEQNAIVRGVEKKFTGTGGKRIVFNFVSDESQSPKVETFELSDAPQQYEFLSNESQRKILVSHRVTSPMLLGIKDQTGLGNNADEISTAFVLFHNTVIKPFQELLLEAVDTVLSINGVHADVFFKSLQPQEFMSEESIAEETVDEASEEVVEEVSEEVSGEPTQDTELSVEQPQVVEESIIKRVLDTLRGK